LAEKQENAGSKKKRLFEMYGDPTHMLRQTKKQI